MRFADFLNSLLSPLTEGAKALLRRAGNTQGSWIENETAARKYRHGRNVRTAMARVSRRRNRR